MSKAAPLKLFDVSWTCPTEGCFEEHGHATHHTDVKAILPIREICRKCSLPQVLDYVGKSVGVLGHPDVKVHVRKIRLMNAGTITVSDEDIYGYPAPYYPQEVYREALDGLQRLAATTVEGNLNGLLKRIIFQQFITIVETLLHDTIAMVVRTDARVANAIVLHPRLFTDFTTSIKAIAAEPDFVRNRVIESIQNTSWHNFKKVEPMFSAVFATELFQDQDLRKRLIDAILIRHDIVHRNGKTKEGDPIEISDRDLQCLSMDVHELAQHVCDTFEAWNVNHRFKDVPAQDTEGDSGFGPA